MAMVAEMNGLPFEHNGSIGQFLVIFRGSRCLPIPHAPPPLYIPHAGPFAWTSSAFLFVWEVCNAITSIHSLYTPTQVASSTELCYMERAGCRKCLLVGSLTSAPLPWLGSYNRFSYNDKSFLAYFPYPVRKYWDMTWLRKGKFIICACRVLLRLSNQEGWSSLDIRILNC
jgi:hypothetical protein